MVFIVGQTEQASEKANLLEQLGQVFVPRGGFFLINNRMICFSFSRNNDKISVVQNLMILMIQVKPMMTSKRH